MHHSNKGSILDALPCCHVVGLALSPFGKPQTTYEFTKGDVRQTIVYKEN